MLQWNLIYRSTTIYNILKAGYKEATSLSQLWFAARRAQMLLQSNFRRALFAERAGQLPPN